MEDITKMCTKHLKEHLMVRSFTTAGNKQVLVNCLAKCITNNAPITDRLKIITPLPIMRQRTLINRILLCSNQAIAMNLV